MTAVLRESSEAAARERLRLEAIRGRHGVAAALSMLPLKLRHLGSDDAARSGLRYQPVAWATIAVAAVAFYFPGRPDPVAETTPLAAPRTAVAGAATTPTSSPLAPASPTPSSASLPPPSAGFSPTAAPTFAPPPPSTSFTPSGPAPSESSTGSLSVRGAGWASSLSGTGLGSVDVPEGTLPVANRLGQVDKASFVRLAGDGSTLVVLEDTEGAREALGAGLVVACPITDPGWAEEPDQSLGDAPAWDDASCVAAVEDDDTWTFELAAVGDPSADTGFALVPDPAAPPDFQVTFTPA